MDHSHRDPNSVRTSYPFNERHTTSSFAAVCQTCDSTKIITKSAAMRPQENMHNGLVNKGKDLYLTLKLPIVRLAYIGLQCFDLVFHTTGSIFELLGYRVRTLKAR